MVHVLSIHHGRILKSISIALLGLVCFPNLSASAQTSNRTLVLNPADYRHYVTSFLQQEIAATGKPGDDSWQWMQDNIPWFDSSAKDFEEMYYFRWFAFQKHVISTPRGFVITEFIPKVAWGGYFNTIVDAAPFHLYEARWLRDHRVAADYARFWMSADARPRNYSAPLADAIRAVTLATGDTHLGTDLLPAMETNYRAWEASNQDANGLFWSIDTRDAMEHSIGGDGYRPTLNSYMYADALAIAALASQAADSSAAREFTQKAKAQYERIEGQLWNPRDQFYEVLSPSRDSGIRKQKKFVDPDTVLQFSGARELIGYIPWMYYNPSPNHAVAWKQLIDPQGFDGKYGPTTAERRSPRFRYANPDRCQWNGPSWPFATTQTLIALANLENDQQQNYISKADYLHLFQTYVLSQHLRLPNGSVIPWIDEDLDADTDQWIARDILAKRHSPQAGRGAYYNHSGFADPLITGLIGLRLSADDKIVLNPLLPPNAWSYFALDALPWHGHLLTIIYDPSGRQYHRGHGFLLFVDGRKCAARRTLGPLQYQLKEFSGSHQD